MKDVSQYGEATKLIEHFEKHPPRHKVLVDVGASRIELSNTYNLLKDHGWWGLLIEADPDERFLELKNSLNGRVAFFEGVAISDQCGWAAWYRKEPRGHSSLFGMGVPTRKIITSTLEKVLDRFQVPFGFGLLSVDAEGMDERILSEFIRSFYLPEVIVHEKGKQAFDFLESNYKPLFETKANTAWVVKCMC